MASSMPEIGSKISLISKADIRYEGKLFTVDPNECTIALSHVRSFGTEDRQTQYPVPAQSQVYEYILFRGSDIKDISIVNTQQLPNDPAIVSGMAPSMPNAYPGHNYAPVLTAPLGPQYGSASGGYMAPGMGRSLGKQGVASELLSHPPPQEPAQVQVQVPVIPIVKEPVGELLAGSRSSTPSLNRRSPTIDQAVQVSPHKDKKSIQPPVPREGRQNNRNDRGYQQGGDGYQRRDYRDRGQRDSQGDRDYRPREREGQRDDYRNQRDNYRDPREDYRNPREDYRNSRDQGDRRDMHQQQLQRQNQGQNRGGWVNRGGRGGGPGMRGRGRGGLGANFNRAPGPGNQNQQNNAAGNKKNTLKFDEEYDFDKANSEFEELRSKTAKLKISAGEGEAEKPKLNGEEKKDDSGNETGLGENEQEEEAEQDPTAFYDKTKSFFDNISCEAVERSKGRSQRTDWRTERKLNSETFGVASARRGGYRGRGGYYGGRAMYRGYRGYNPRGQQHNNRNNIGQPRPTQPPTAAAK